MNLYNLYIKRLPDAPYNVYNKYTESIISKRTKTISDLVLKNNSSRYFINLLITLYKLYKIIFIFYNKFQSFEHLIRHRIGPTTSQSTVNFEISLRGNP